MALKAVVSTQIASFVSELKVPSTTSRSEVVKLNIKKKVLKPGSLLSSRTVNQQRRDKKFSSVL